MAPKNDSAKLRERQIQDLESKYRNRLRLENGTYSISLDQFGPLVQLHIKLPPKFPTEPPQMSVTPAVVHPNVAADTRVQNLTRLSSWAASSSLTLAVDDLINAFTKLPPKLAQTTARPYTPAGSSGPASMYNGGQQAGPTGVAVYPPPPPPTSKPMPPTPGRASTTGQSVFDHLQQRVKYELSTELRSKSFEELQVMSSDPDLIGVLVASLDVLVALRTEVEALEQDVERLARENLDKEARLREPQERLAALQRDLAGHAGQYEMIAAQISDVAKRYSPEAILSRLEADVRKWTDEEKRLRTAFLGGQVDADTFVKQYTEASVQAKRASDRFARLNSPGERHRLGRLVVQGVFPRLDSV